MAPTIQTHECPEDFVYLYNIFLVMSGMRQRCAEGPLALAYSDFYFREHVTRTALDSFEVECILQLDTLWRKALRHD